jgi:hypothetical protein
MKYLKMLAVAHTYSGPHFSYCGHCIFSILAVVVAAVGQ